ncbi:hypothetical protein ACKAV7_008457 [Fusarium commune]
MLVSSLVVVLYAVGARAALRQFNFTAHSAFNSLGIDANCCTDGFEREVYLINDQQPGPLVDVDEGDDVEIFVHNDLNVETTIHWHGLLQRGTPHMDGVPGIIKDPIPPGGNFTYRFSTASEYGFFWYHSHFRAYYNDAIRGPLLIRPAASRQRPFKTLAQDEDELVTLLAAERNAKYVLLSDWTHELSDVTFARYMKTGAFPSCVDSILANGQGRVQCLPKSALESGPGLGIEPKRTTTALGTSANTSEMQHMSDMPSMDMSKGREMHDMPMESPVSPVTSRPETCTNTTSPLLVISKDQSKGWFALNLVNSGTVSALRVSLDGHSMFVYAADGLYTKLQEVNADNSSTTDVMEDPAKSWMYINGSAKADAALLDPSALSAFDGHNSPPSGRPDKTLSFVVSQTDIVTWVIDRAPFSEPDVPIIYGENSSGWISSTTMHLPINSTIDIIMNISNQSMDVVMARDYFRMQLSQTRQRTLLTFGILLTETRWASLRKGGLRSGKSRREEINICTAAKKSLYSYVTDNPGAWMFHCHLQWHAVVGMAMVLVEGGDQLPALVGQCNKTADRSGATELIASRYGPSATLVAIVVVAITLWY